MTNLALAAVTRRAKTAQPVECVSMTERPVGHRTTIAVGLFHIRIDYPLIAETIRQKRQRDNWTTSLPLNLKGGS